MKAKVLLFDIETCPIIAHVWGLWENNVALNQVQEDWHMLSWAAKWLEPGPYAKTDKDVMYEDLRGKKLTNEKALLRSIWKLLDKADVVITQNGKRFDRRKLNAKFLEYGLGKPSSFKHIDTKVLAKTHFDLPSYRLEYMTEKFCKKWKKLKHKKFPGHEMWNAVMADNKTAWNEMEKYNKHDVLSLEELYHVFAPWDNTINWSVYEENAVNICQCGCKKFKANGHDYTKKGKFQRFKCKRCGREMKSSKNLFDTKQKKCLLVPN